jgi:alpha-N-arabinofuranosidase
LPDHLVNGDFEHFSGEVPDGWTLDPVVRDKGSLSVANADSVPSHHILSLQPTGRNSDQKPFGIGEMLDARALRGRNIRIEAQLGAAKGATAVVGIHALADGKDVGFVQMRQDDSSGVLHEQSQILEIPKAADRIVVYVVVIGNSGAARVGALKLAPLDASSAGGADEAALATQSAVLHIDVRHTIRTIPSSIYGTNAEWIFDGQGLWSSRSGALDQEALRLVRELGPTMIRFPGGVFSDTYHWRDGLGPQEKRPTTAHYPKGPESRHTFGIGEVADVARQADAQLLLTVNAGTGTAQEAADWVRYMNRGAGPKVDFWEVGNELYMKDDLSGAQMSAEKYARTYAEFAKAMRAVDPSIKIGAIGGVNFGKYHFIADDHWTETVLEENRGQVDFLAIHNAYAPVLIGSSAAADPHGVYAAMLAAPSQVEANLADVSRLLARYETSTRPIAIAVTEWGPFFDISPNSPWVDHVKTMGSGLFVASMLDVFLRTPRVEIANFFKLVDHGFMGWIGTRDGHWTATAPYMVFSLFRHNLGNTLVQSSIEGPSFDGPGIGVVSASRGIPVLDAVATFEGGMLTVIVVNRSETAEISTRLSVAGVKRYSGVHVQTIYADSLDANTGSQLPTIPGLNWAKQTSLGRMERGGPQEIHMTSEDLSGAPSDSTGALISYPFRALSVTCLRFSIPPR